MRDGQLPLYNRKEGGEGHSDGEVEEPEAPEDQEEEDFHGCRLYTLSDECSSRNSDVNHVPIIRLCYLHSTKSIDCDSGGQLRKAA